MKTLIKKARVIDPASNKDEILDVLIENGLIAKLAEHIESESQDTQLIDASGLVMMPGLVDMHVHLREPGQEAKEDIYTGTCAAAAGGFTTVACMANTSPSIDTSAMVNAVKKRADLVGKVKVEVIGALSKGLKGQELAEIGDMIAAGAVAISDDGALVTNTKLQYNALEYAGMYKVPVISHAEDEFLVEGGAMNEGVVSNMLGVKGRPSLAEEIIVMRDIMLGEYTGSWVHIAHVSSKGSVEIIRQAKSKGIKVTAEATPHHLSLTDEQVKTFDTAFKVNPPLRTQSDIEALYEGLKDGTIDAIVTDHAPHAWEEKDVEFKFAPSGFTGLETSLGVILTEYYHTSKLSLMEIAKLMAYNPSKILNLNRGEIAEGKPADLVLIDLNHEWTVDQKKFYSRGKTTPFEGRRLKGKAVMTILDGKKIMTKGEVL